MTLHPQDDFSIPEETARIARAAYPQGNVYMKMRDALGIIYHDQTFAHLFPHNGRPVEAPWRLALITIMQFMEDLPDRQAADAVRGRIDWKYALNLELTDPGFDLTLLSDFRKRLVEHGAEQLLLDALLTIFKEKGWLRERGKQRTDSTHVLAKIRAINRLICVGEALRFALNSLASLAPQWLVQWGDEAWVDRYGHRIEQTRLPKSKAEREKLAETIGRDGCTLLTDIYAPSAPLFLRGIPAVQILRQIWVQNYYLTDEQVHWRANEDIPPPARFISSPYDPEARYSKKRETTWVGYKVHLTEVCDEEYPHFLTQVTTTPAPKGDEAMVESIHEKLKQEQLLPSHHLLDSGYVTAENLATSLHAYDVQVIGPTLADHKWQASLNTGFAASQFVIDWEQKRATCPEGHTSINWTPTIDIRGHEIMKIRFSTKDCRPCPSRMLCTQSRVSAPRRLLSVRRQEQYLALQAARKLQTSQEFARQYALRGGIEATISQGVRAFGMRRSRYVGEMKTHLQHVGIAAAINVLRALSWLDGEALAPTRRSALQRLYYAA